MSEEELEIKNVLPNGWAYAGLEDISDIDKHSIKRGPFGSALKKAFFVPEGYKVYEQGNVINNDFDRGTYFIDEEKYEDLKSFSIKPKDILMSCAGTVGKLAIVPEEVQEGVINQALLKLSVHPDIDLQYFFKLFSYQIDEILKDNLRGSAMMNLTSVKDLKLVRFPIAPYNEQKRIVSKIEKLFSNLDNSDKYLVHLEKQLKRYRQSVLKSAFEGELTKEWRKQQSEDIKWKTKNFIDFCKIQRGHDLPLKNIVKGSYPVISSGGIAGFHNEYKIEGPALITGRSGGVGNIHFLECAYYWPHNTVLYVKDFIGNYPKYVYYFFLSFDFKSYSSSTAVPTLNRNLLSKVPVKVPRVNEQKEIVNQIEKHFSIIDKLEDTVQKSIKESKRLRQSILKQAFEGKLVEEDKNDESAEILLEKIAKAKEEYKKAIKEQNKRKK